MLPRKSRFPLLEAALCAGRITGRGLPTKRTYRPQYDEPDQRAMERLGDHMADEPNALAMEDDDDD